MKRILVLMLTALLVISCTACGGKKESKQEQEKQTVTEAPKAVSAAEDTDAMNLHFTPPEGYATVERHVGKSAAGKVTEKSFNYSFADNSSVMIGYTVGKELTDSVPQNALDKAENVTYAGKAFQVIHQGKAAADEAGIDDKEKQVTLRHDAIQGGRTGKDEADLDQF